MGLDPSPPPLIVCGYHLICHDISKKVGSRVYDIYVRLWLLPTFCKSIIYNASRLHIMKVDYICWKSIIYVYYFLWYIIWYIMIYHRTLLLPRVAASCCSYIKLVTATIVRIYHRYIIDIYHRFSIDFQTIVNILCVYTNHHICVYKPSYMCTIVAVTNLI